MVLSVYTMSADFSRVHASRPRTPGVSVSTFPSRVGSTTPCSGRAFPPGRFLSMGLVAPPPGRLLDVASRFPGRNTHRQERTPCQTP